MTACYHDSMIKKMVYLEEEQDRIVKRLAREAKTSETEVIRRAIEAYDRTEAAQMAADTRRVMEHIAGYPEWNDDPEEFFKG